MHSNPHDLFCTVHRHLSIVQFRACEMRVCLFLSGPWYWLPLVSKSGNSSMSYRPCLRILVCVCMCVCAVRATPPVHCTSCLATARGSWSCGHCRPTTSQMADRGTSPLARSEPWPRLALVRCCPVAVPLLSCCCPVAVPLLSDCSHCVVHV